MSSGQGKAEVMSVFQSIRSPKYSKLKWVIHLHLLVYALLLAVWALNYMRDEGVVPTLATLGVAPVDLHKRRAVVLPLSSGQHAGEKSNQ